MVSQRSCSPLCVAVCVGTWATPQHGGILADGLWSLGMRQAECTPQRPGCANEDPFLVASRLVGFRFKFWTDACLTAFWGFLVKQPN